MASTTQIPRDQWEQYFDRFSQRHIQHASPDAVDIETLSVDLGDQFAAEGARLSGIVYDPRTDAIEFSFELTVSESADHRVLHPREVWVIEEPDGFISSLEIVRDDGVRDLATIRKVGVRRMEM